MDNNKTYIWHLKMPDNEDIPYGKYFIDSKTNKLYVCPVNKEMFEKKQKPTMAFLNIITILGVVAGAFYSERISIVLAQNTVLENILLLLACVVFLFALFVCIKKRDLKVRHELVEETGYQMIESGKTEEIAFLKEVAREIRKLIIVYIPSFVVMCVLGYVAISFFNSIFYVHRILPFVLLALFLLPTTMFAFVSVNLDIIMPIRPLIEKRLSILTEENEND